MLFVFYYFIFFYLSANTIRRPTKQLSYEAFVKLPNHIQPFTLSTICNNTLLALRIDRDLGLKISIVLAGIQIKYGAACNELKARYHTKFIKVLHTSHC